MTNDLISIIIPIYNTEEYLERCLNSVINQSYENLEIILINDGSTDASEEICKDYLEKDKRIKYFKKENGGLSSARNYGLKKSSGKYIGFIDSDDVISIDMFLTLYNNLVKTSSDMSICEVVRFKENPEFNNSNNYNIYNSKEILKIILEDKKICNFAVNKLYKKELMKDIEYPIGKYQEDVGTTYKFIKNAKKIVYSDSKLYGYYSRNNSITKSLSTKFVYDYFEMIEKRSKELRNMDIDDYLDLNKSNVILGIFIDLSQNKKLLKDIKFSKYINNKLIELKKLHKNTKKINTLKHNILINILLFNKNIFLVLMNIYLKLKG